MTSKYCYDIPPYQLLSHFLPVLSKVNCTNDTNFIIIRISPDSVVVKTLDLGSRSMGSNLECANY